MRGGAETAKPALGEQRASRRDGVATRVSPASDRPALPRPSRKALAVGPHVRPTRWTTTCDVIRTGVEGCMCLVVTNLGRILRP